MGLGRQGRHAMPRVFAEHSGRGRGAQGGTQCPWAAVPAPWACTSPEASQGPWCWEPFSSRPREQVPRVALAVGRSPAFVPSPIPPAASLPSSDGGRRWQAASPTRLTGRAGLGEPRAPAPCPDPPGPCRGSPGRSGQEGHPGPGSPCRDSAAAPGTRGTGAATLCWGGRPALPHVTRPHAGLQVRGRTRGGSRSDSRACTVAGARRARYTDKQSQAQTHSSVCTHSATGTGTRSCIRMPRCVARAQERCEPPAYADTRRVARCSARACSRLQTWLLTQGPPPTPHPWAHTHRQTGCTQQDGSPSRTRVPFPSPSEDAQVAPSPAVASRSPSCSQLPELGRTLGWAEIPAGC